MRRILLLATLLLAACKVDTAPMEQAHVQRVEGINRQFDAQIDANNARWNALKKKVLQRLQYRIPVVEGTAAQPKEPVMDRFREPWAACIQTADAPACQEQVRKNYGSALSTRYFLADFEWVMQQLGEHADLDIEWLATKSHNEHLTKQVREELAEMEREKNSFASTMNGYRRDEIQSSKQERDQEIDNADQENRARWASALQGLGDGLQAASRSTQQSQSQGYSASGCTSDFACGLVSVA